LLSLSTEQAFFSCEFSKLKLCQEGTTNQAFGRVFRKTQNPAFLLLDLVSQTSKRANVKVSYPNFLSRVVLEQPTQPLSMIFFCLS
jgi:hypothetical protein